VTIVPTGNIPPSTQTLINGQVKGTYDITAGDYVTYIDNEVHGTARLRIIAEASFLQPNVLTLLIKSGSSINSIGQLRGKTVSVNAPDDIGTLLVDSLLVAHGISSSQVKFNNAVPFPAVGQPCRAMQSTQRSPPSPSSASTRRPSAYRNWPTSTRGRPRSSRSRAMRSPKRGRRKTPTP
jgi:ABC-type nitrate/sulfonate/bicarbonate transport system substrate-binding protein